MRNFLLLIFSLTVQFVDGQEIRRNVKSQKVIYSVYSKDTFSYDLYLIKLDPLGDTTDIQINYEKYRKDQDVIMKKKVKYNKKKILEEVDFFENGKLHRKQKISYDEKDSIISIYTWEALGSDSFKESKQNIFRDSFGRKIKLTSINRSSSDKLKSSTKYIYDENGYMIKEIMFDSKNEITSIMELKYNKQGKIIEKSLPKGTYNTGPLKWIYLYDGKGDLTKKMMKDELKKDTVILFESKYDYQDSSYFVTQTTKSIYNEIVGIVKFKYDNKNKLLEAFQYYSSKLNFYFFDKYDKHGRIIKRGQIVNDTLDSETNYIYNDKGLLINEIRNQFLKYPSTNSFIFSYNSEGKKVKTVHYIDDKQNYSETIEYNQDGAIKRTEFEEKYPKFTKKYVYEYIYEYY